jgi:potassium channel subfamily K
VSFNKNPDQRVRFEGRTLITSELILFGVIALNALIFSKIEGWTYVDGLYFSVVVILTIGESLYMKSIAGVSC